MKKVFKYKLRIESKQELYIQKGAEILTGKIIKGIPVLWALVDPDAEFETKEIYLYGTGHNIDRDDLKHITTLSIDGGALIFHMFYV